MQKTYLPFLILLILGLAIGLLIFWQPFEQQVPKVMKQQELEQVLTDGVGQGVALDVRELAREELTLGEAETKSMPKLEEPFVLVRIHDVSGQGIAGAQVFAWVGEEVYAQGETNEAGEVILQSLSGSGGLVIVAPGSLPMAFLRSFDEGALELRIEVEEVLSGKVVFFRPRHSSESFQLQLDGLWWRGREDVPPPVYEVLFLKGVMWNAIKIPVDSAGQFRLMGIPARWRGRIYVPPGMMVRSFQGLGEIFPPHMVKIEGAQQNVVLELVEFPEIRGRVVTPDGSKGVAGVKITMRVFFDIEGTASANLAATSGEKGVFQTPFRVYGDEIYALWCENPESAAPVRVKGALQANQEWAGVEFAFELAGRPDPWDFGDLHLKNQTQLALHVVDSQGNPVAGAFAFGGALSEATDADGNTKVAVWQETETVEIAAEGFNTVSLRLPDSLPDTLEVTLSPAARLLVHWNAPESPHTPRLKLRIQSEGRIFSFREFDIGSFKADFLPVFQRDFAQGNSLPIAGRWIDWKVNPQQQSFSIWGLQPGVPMQIMLVGRKGMPYASSPSLVFIAGEEREVELQLPGSLPAFEGIVLDYGGAPVATAAVIIGGYGVATTAEGKFRLEGFAPQEVDLSIRKDGYGTLVFPKFRFSADGIPSVFTLEAARQVKVFLRDSTGQDYAGGFVSLGFASGEYIDLAYAKDGYQLHQVPQNGCDIYWALGDLSGHDWIPADVEEYVIEVPVMAISTVCISRQSAVGAQSCRIECWPMSEKFIWPEDFYFTRIFDFADGQREVEFELPPLASGPYRVILSSWSGPGDEDFEPLPELGIFEITPGQSLELDLDY